MKLTDIKQEELNQTIEEAIIALAELLDIQLEYDYEIVEYTTGEGEDRELIRLKFRCDQDSLLIGYHGKTLNKLQHLISMMLSTKYEELVRVVLDINEYRSKREESLENLAKRAEQQVLETGHAMELQPMSAAERRIIHKTLSDANENEATQVTTESIGEGRDRRVIIKPIDQVDQN